MPEAGSNHLDLSVPQPGLEVVSPKFRAERLALRIRFKLRHQLEKQGIPKPQIDTLLELRRLHHGRFK